MSPLLESIGQRHARYLSKPRTGQSHPATVRSDRFQATLRKGDMLLIEGVSRISASIKYLVS